MNAESNQPAEPGAAARGPYLLPPVNSRHEAESRRMISAAAAAVPPGRAVVLGAGRADEIPLAELVARFGQVTLNDVELAPMGHAMAAAKIDQTSRQKVITHVGDLTGITAALLAKIGAVVDAGTEPGAVIEQMAALVAAHGAAGMFPAGKFDLVVASCVLSQLHVGLVHGAREAFSKRFPNDVQALDAAVKDEGVDRIGRFVYQLGVAASRHGILRRSGRAGCRPRADLFVRVGADVLRRADPLGPVENRGYVVHAAH